jgi:outer membrane autotransporter protein
VDGVVNESVAGGVLALGVTGGYVAAWQDFNSGSQADYEGFSGGLYATYVNGGFHLDSEFRANILDLDYSMVAMPTSHADVTSLGGSVEAGYRIDMTDSFFAEPVARLAYVDTAIRNGGVLGVEFDGDGESFRGAVGLNLGGVLNGGADIVFKPELSAKVWS